MLACTSSISVALLIRKAMSTRIKGLTGARLVMANSFVAFCASSSAGFINAMSMRKTEMKVGIDVMDPTEPEKPIGIKSQAAAKAAVFQTAISRSFLSVPLMLPSLLFMTLEKCKLMPRSFALKTVVEGATFFAMLYFSVPFAIAIYPQTATIKSDHLEPALQEWKNTQGEHLQMFVFNKGL
jgi:hypothetical protein